ncbi:UNVERIFIED_CONTAM: hypothetical protein FKN15_070788 [Acipenser sinensis]
MGGKRRKSCKKQQQQLPPGDIGPIYKVGEWCPGFGEFGHTVAICPTQTEVRRRRQRGRKTWDEEEWCTNCMQYRHEDHHCLEVLQDTDLEWEEPECPAPEWEDPGRPAPEWEEPERPAAEWEEPEHPDPEWEEPERSAPEWEEPEHPQPKRGESVRPQPKRGSRFVHNPRGGRPNVHTQVSASKGRLPAGSTSTALGGLSVAPTSTSRGRVPAGSTSTIVGG